MPLHHDSGAHNFIIYPLSCQITVKGGNNRKKERKSQCGGLRNEGVSLVQPCPLNLTPSRETPESGSMHGWWIHRSMPCRYVGSIMGREQTVFIRGQVRLLRGGAAAPLLPPCLPAPPLSCMVGGSLKTGNSDAGSRQSCTHARMDDGHEERVQSGVTDPGPSGASFTDHYGISRLVKRSCKVVYLETTTNRICELL
jgi:hypothetical protein